MQAEHLKNNEAQALYQYQILDTDPEKAFDDLTRLAAYIWEPLLPWSACSTPNGSSRRSVGMQRKHLAICILQQPSCNPTFLLLLH